MDRWRGSWTIAHWRKMPIRLHLSLPIGLLWFSRLEFRPGLWAGIILLVLAHELGHAALVRYNRATPLHVVLHGFGGECLWVGKVSPLARSFIAAGGVLAQLVVFVIVGQMIRVSPPTHQFTAEIAGVLGGFINLEMIAINLIPIRPLDGAEVWRGIPLLLQRLKPSAVEKKFLRDATLGAGNAEALKRADRKEGRALKLVRDEDEPVSPDVEKLVDKIIDDAKK